MVDPLKAVAGAIDLAKEVNRMDLYRELVEANQEIVRQARENIELQKKVMGLEQRLKLQTEMVRHDNVYWMKQSDGTEVGPYCPKCKDGEASKAVPMILQESDNTIWICPVCDLVIDRPGMQRPRARHSRPGDGQR